jgi:uncharacterized protein (TIGR00369 family)
MSLVNEIAAGKSGLEQLRALIGAGLNAGIGGSLKFSLVEISEGVAVFEAVPGQHAYNPIGMIHGGYASTLLDSACGCAVHSRLSATQAYTTLELKVSFLRKLTADSGRVRAEGRVLSLGRRAAFAEAKLTDGEGKLCATATSTLLIMDRT